MRAFRPGVIIAIAAQGAIRASMAEAAPVVFDESLYGDLPDVPVLSPQGPVYSFDLVPGRNSIKGSTSLLLIAVDEASRKEVDYDSYQISIPEGFECSKIRFTYRLDVSPNLGGYIFRLEAGDRVTGAYYQDDEIFFTSPDFGSDPVNKSPVKFFNEVGHETRIPPLDIFPIDGLTLSSGAWDFTIAWSSVSWVGAEPATIKLDYKIDYVVTPAHGEGAGAATVEFVRETKGKPALGAKGLRAAHHGNTLK